MKSVTEKRHLEMWYSTGKNAGMENSNSNARGKVRASVLQFFFEVRW